MSTEEDVAALRERVAELEAQIDELADPDRVATDSGGRSWSVGDLMGIGLSRREALLAFGALATAGYTLPRAITYAIGTASAQSAVGQVGRSSERVDVYAAALDAVSVNGGGPISDGDGTERQLWVIANGAGDPAGADAADLIFEEEA